MPITTQEPRAITINPTEPAHVVITRIDLSFGNLISLMVKVAICTVPAGAIIGLIALAAFFVGIAGAK